jgi:hypothetical protein
MERVPLGEPEQSILPLHDNRVRLSCAWRSDPEEVEMIEEYVLLDGSDGPRKTGLLMRKWRKNGKIKGPTPWIIEIGQPTSKQPSPSGAQSNMGSTNKLMVEASASNPQFVARDTSLFLVYLVENITFPYDIYNLSVNVSSQLQIPIFYQ